MEHLESVAAFAVATPSQSNLSLCGWGSGREGVIMREMSHPVYKPLLRFVLRLRLQKGGGAYLQDTTVQSYTGK